ncbi:MAG: ABC transporter permease [Alphaproteobacteria bacterium]|nr:ABC transporter permease [Alphaproteobacteria bacterium]
MTETQVTATDSIGVRPVGLWRRALRHPGFVVGGVLLLFFVLVALGADLLAPHDPYAQSLVRRLRPPVWSANGSWTFILGTDPFGRDYLSRLMHGARIALAVAFASALLAGAIGATLGVLAGYFRGRVDQVISLLISTRLALPALLVALAVLQVAGSGLWIVVLVLGSTLWDRFAVVMRTAVMQVSSLDYVMAARAAGASHGRIMTREVAPNVLGHFLVVFSYEAGQAVLAAAALSFLGLGIQAPQPSWGLMMAEGRSWLLVNPWLIANAGVALMLLVLAMNLVGDGLRDVLTPGERF